MTQQQLGEKADVNYKYLGAIERGEKNPTTEHLAKIAKALNVDIYELFIFEHEVGEKESLKDKIDEMMKDASIKEYKMIFRIIQAVLR